LVVICATSIFVTLLLAYVCIKFRAKKNPVPSKTSHNTFIEIIWTVVPIVILVAITIPSMKTLYYNETIVDAEMTLKVIGNQWYWSYQYPDHENISFDSNIIRDEDLKEGDIRLLSVDNQVVLPVDTTIRIQATGADVIHNWAVPAFGTKLEAVPGKLNEGWIRVDKIGTYYGQCSELCGTGHGFMPIAVNVVSKEDFAKWVESKRTIPPVIENTQDTSLTN
jgi:cytochrome c oxidase subunit 2